MKCWVISILITYPSSTDLQLGQVTEIQLPNPEDELE